MAYNKRSGRQISLNKISVEKCLEALAIMHEQMRMILPYVPEHLSSQIRLPLLGCLPLPEVKKYTRLMATRKNPDGTVTKMFAIRKNLTSESDVSSDRIVSISGSESESIPKNFENDPILKNSQEFLENFKNGAIQRELNRRKSELPPPCKPIKFPSITHQTPETPLEKITCEEPNILKEQPPDTTTYAKIQKSINLFKSKEEAERFMMFTIKEIIQLFSQIANAFKLDAVKGMNYPPTDISQKEYMLQCCMQTMRELQLLVNGPVKNLRNELTQKFITVLPEYNCVLGNIKKLDDSLWQTESFSDGYHRERAPGDGC